MIGTDCEAVVRRAAAGVRPLRPFEPDAEAVEAVDQDRGRLRARAVCSTAAPSFVMTGAGAGSAGSRCATRSRLASAAKTASTITGCFTVFFMRPDCSGDWPRVIPPWDPGHAAVPTVAPALRYDPGVPTGARLFAAAAALSITLGALPAPARIFRAARSSTRSSAPAIRRRPTRSTSRRSYSPDRAWSLLVAFHPAARGRAMVEKYQAAAEAVRLHRRGLEQLAQRFVAGVGAERSRRCCPTSASAFRSTPIAST